MRCGGLRSSRGRGRVRARRSALHFEGLELTKISVSVASRRARDEHAGMVPNVLQSEGDETFAASMTTTEKGRAKIEGTLGEKKEEWRVLIVSFEMELKEFVKTMRCWLWL